MLQMVPIDLFRRTFYTLIRRKTQRSIINLNVTTNPPNPQNFNEVSQ